MAENNESGKSLESAANTLSEQTRKIEIARHYTHGDFEKAKQMIAGSYKDVCAIKAKYSSSNICGAFMLFMNVPSRLLTHFYGIVTQSYSVNEIKTNIDWRTFEQEIAQNLVKGEHDGVLTASTEEDLVKGITFQLIEEVNKLIEVNDEIAVNHLFQRLLLEKLGYAQIDISVDFQQTTSLDMELYSISSPKIDLKKLSEEEGKDKKEDNKQEDPKHDPLHGKDIKLILSGELLLSPIKGKDISKLVIGDRVKIRLTDSNPKAVSLAKAFNSYEDGNLLPIAGRIVSIRQIPGSGYKIFAVVAKGIYIKIEEEEESIKVSMVQPVEADSARSSGSPRIRISLIIVLVIVLFILVGAIFIFVVF